MPESQSSTINNNVQVIIKLVLYPVLMVLYPAADDMDNLSCLVIADILGKGSEEAKIV